MEQNSYLNLMPAHHLSMSSPAGTPKFKPIPTPRPHDNRRFLSLRPSHVFHFMTMSYYHEWTQKENVQNRGVYKHTHVQNPEEEWNNIPKIGETRAACWASHLLMRVIILTKNKSRLILRLRSVCLISCLYFSSSAGHWNEHTPIVKNQGLSHPTGGNKNDLSLRLRYYFRVCFDFCLSSLRWKQTSTRSIFLFLILANEFLSWRVTRRRCLNFHSTIFKKYCLWTVIHSVSTLFGGFFTNKPLTRRQFGLVAWLSWMVNAFNPSVTAHTDA